MASIGGENFREQHGSGRVIDPNGQCELRGIHMVPHDSPHYEPLILPQTMSLGEISSRMGNHFGVFVSDESGHIVGLISADEIASRLNMGHPRERERWAQSPLSSLLLTRLFAAQTGEMNSQSFDSSTAILDEGQIVGLATESDVLISWRHILPALTKAATDPLTSLINRASFERRLHEEWDRSTRWNQSIGVIFCDIDRFKSINDTYGHQFGDMVIQNIARILEASLRSYDLVSRYGGDEFVCLCMGCRPGEIAIPLSRVLSEVNAFVHSRHGKSLQATATLGAAVFHVGFDRLEPYDLVQAADQCLYRAKSEGRGLGYFQDVEHLAQPVQEIVMVPITGVEEAVDSEVSNSDEVAV